MSSSRWDALLASMTSSMASLNRWEVRYDVNECCSLWFDSYLSLSISSLWGRTNTSSSESSCGCSNASYKCHSRLGTSKGTSSWSPRRGLVGTQIMPARPWEMQPLQCSSKQHASTILIFEGSFHSKLAGVHSLAIQDDGSLASAPHGIIIFLFPAVKPCSS